MATIIDADEAVDPDYHLPEISNTSVGRTLLAILKVLASLKITVALLAMAIFIVFAGTLAQTRKDIWVVVHDYFRTYMAWIEFQVFFPKSIFKDMGPVSGGFYFPGGWLIGFLMAINLVAAHAVRFTIQSSGIRLNIGLAVIGLGVVMTWLVIGGGSGDGLQAASIISWSTLWLFVKVLLAALSLCGGYLASRLDAARRTERWGLAILSALIGGLAGWLFYEGSAAVLGDSSMRILWQLLQGGFAGLILLGGGWLVFRKRAGIVLLHAGIGLLMFSELLVGTTAVETRMTITEGQTVNFVQDLHNSELAIVHSAGRDEDEVVVVPQSILLRSSSLHHAFLPKWLYEPLPDWFNRGIGCTYGEKRISHQELPFDVEVVRFFVNSSVPRRIKPDDDNPATDGAGKEIIVDERSPGTGTDADSKIDMPAAYVNLFKKGTDESLGIFLFGVMLSAQDHSEKIVVDGKSYDVSLRFKHIYKPYSMRLIDVRADNYLGTEMTRNYSSDVRLVDPARKIDRDVHIWMNNPLRFADETFYQSSFDRNPRTGVETTGFQVVSNTGWMIPYVSCMIVGVGMLFQFGVTLLRFLDRKSAESQRTAQATVLHGAADPRRTDRIRGRKARDERSTNPPTPGDGRRFAALASRIVPASIVLLFAAYVGGKATPPGVSPDGFNFYEAGKLPVVYAGRVKPLDTLARNSLKIISWREDFTDEAGKNQPAVRWLLDLATNPDVVEKHAVFEIDNPEILDLYKLPLRKTHLYSGLELRPHIKDIASRVDAARRGDTPPERLSVLERRLIELERRIREVKLLEGTFVPPPLSEIPQPDDMRSPDPKARERVADFREAVIDMPRRLAAVHPPLIVPTEFDPRDPFSGVTATEEKPEKFDWQPFSTAWTRSSVKSRMLGLDPDPATAAWARILVAYTKGEAGEFNRAVREYQELISRNPPPQLASADLQFESFFNHFSPFYYSAVLYLCVFLLAVVSWLVWTKPLGRAAFGLTLLALAVHSFALVARIYISGRPPVTNLYTTAVFIGWGCVVICLLFELFHWTGVGCVISGLAGFATLLISHFLSGDGDTFTVLQAVLDTQFWLATHVVIINLGYAATLLAGLFGMLYVVRGVATPSLPTEFERGLGRMTYGTLCFAIFFSFVGTVLGGLWADDSWGRFWGWDPKENGALLIVLWNALVLHARWGGMIKNRGLAVLVMGGSIITAWSWFGVNELGVGLHNYGFKSGVLQNMRNWDFAQVVGIILGCLPRHLWLSSRTPANAGEPGT